MDFGAHLPLMDFGGNPYTLEHLVAYTQTAARLGFRALATNDHMVFSVPWLDGPIALAAVIGHSGTMTLATTVSLPVIRGPLPLAKTLAAIDRLSQGRLVVAVGPGSSQEDFDRSAAPAQPVEPPARPADRKGRYRTGRRADRYRPLLRRKADALGRLISKLTPRVIRIFLTSAASVDGKALAARLTASHAKVEILSYVPDRFTHAKLVGITRSPSGWLLSGSANLSHAALTLPTAVGGNVELAVLSALPSDQVRACFYPPEVTADSRDLDSLDALKYETDIDRTPPALPVQLARAVAEPDGRVAVITDPAAQPGWQWPTTKFGDHSIPPPPAPSPPGRCRAPWCELPIPAASPYPVRR